LKVTMVRSRCIWREKLVGNEMANFYLQFSMRFSQVRRRFTGIAIGLLVCLVWMKWFVWIACQSDDWIMEITKMRLRANHSNGFRWFWHISRCYQLNLIC
jgi:hypothetical protein